jgi:bifunctional non-homologous end joining protein LigD
VAKQAKKPKKTKATEADERLGAYRSKRSAERTPEPVPPSGEVGDGAGSGDRFVIQEHHATRLHWDFRLERDGVLVSWALPRGVPLDPKDNHLAVHTEDHPLDYFDFEGEIPKGEYGGGRVTKWDSGTYETEKFRHDEVMIRLHGERVEGRYVLFQTGKKGGEGRAAERNWMIHRMDPAPEGWEPLPERIEPMKATLAKLPRDDEGWAYEIKWDGVRAVAICETGRVSLHSRTLRDISAQYPEVRSIALELEGRQAVLDGEIVAFDAEGRPSFQRLQRRIHVAAEAEVRKRRRDVPVTYVIFDVLHLDGESLIDLPYEERRERLEGLELDGESWQVPSFHRGDGAAMLELSRERGLEGVVAKKLGSPYRPGRRSREWLKIKNVRGQEVVVGGWVPGKGRREGDIGALLVGVNEGEGAERRLRFAGKVGTGFGAAELRMLSERLGALRRDDSPFEGRQPQKDAIFAEPELVAEVVFSEWTDAGTLRQPAYKGLRDDKPASAVIREEPAGP